MAGKSSLVSAPKACRQKVHEKSLDNVRADLPEMLQIIGHAAKIAERIAPVRF